METIRLLFELKIRVGRKEYFFWGAVLMLLKYLGEVAIYYSVKGQWLSPLDFVSPLFAHRYPELVPIPDWFGPAVALWTLPFVWVGVGMSIRRAADAGLSPWVGLLFFVPIVNWLMMAGLSLAPTGKAAYWQESQKKLASVGLSQSLLVSFGFAVVGTLMVWLSANVLKTYAVSLFIGGPLVLGLLQAYLLNLKNEENIIRSVGFVALSVVLVHLMLLLFALEGAICLLMSFPLSLGFGILGAAFGWAVARYGRSGALSSGFLALAVPLMPVAETQVNQTHRDVVLTSIEINVPPEMVWPNVVKFSDLPKNNDWLFKLGVAHPLRARIEGSGVGAIRHCEFSTGSFVEPITVWDEPSHLAFDVKYQPEPMKEVSFYDHVDAPHLDGYFRSVKGEFRLIALGDGKTRLEGRTWYEMEIQPGWYWQIFGRWFIHKIHFRVLDHIKTLSEN